MPSETNITREDVLEIAHGIARVATDARGHRLTVSCNIHRVPLAILNQIAAMHDSQIEHYPADERCSDFQTATITIAGQHVTLFAHADSL